MRELAATPEAQRPLDFCRAAGTAPSSLSWAPTAAFAGPSTPRSTGSRRSSSANWATGGRPDVIAVGRKVKGLFPLPGREVAESLEGFTDKPRFEDAQRVVEAISRELETGTIGQIFLVSTHFLSVGTQRAERRRLVPLDLPNEKRRKRRAGRDDDFRVRAGT